jgi:high-affinity iron transporter
LGDVLVAGFLMGLREGLAAAFVVALAARRRPGLAPVWGGVGAGVIGAVVLGLWVTYGSPEPAYGVRPVLFEATTSMLAAGLAGCLMRWAGGGIAAVLVFLLVLRAGVASVLVILSAAGAAPAAAPLAGVLGGLASGVLLGALVYALPGRGSAWTGVLLALVAAGLAKHAVHHLQLAGGLPGRDSTAYDLSTVVEPASWSGTVLAATFDLTPTSTVLELRVWFVCAVGALALGAASRKAAS